MEGFGKRQCRSASGMRDVWQVRREGLGFMKDATPTTQKHHDMGPLRMKLTNQAVSVELAGELAWTLTTLTLDEVIVHQRLQD